MDGIDECLNDFARVGHLLTEVLCQKQISADRLFLRLSCRTADWSRLSTLKNALQNKWQELFAEIELCPLRIVDVEDAARNAGLVPDKFLDEVHGRGVGSFAAKPITLFSLFDKYARDSHLPSSRAEIFEDLCRRALH